MPDAHRTLVKSPPELWAEVSDAASLARHLGEFGEIRITRTQPETIVAWEGDRVRGTVELEPAGWGTKVTLTAEVDEEPAPEPVGVVEPEPEPAPEPVGVVEHEPAAVAEPVVAAPPKRSWLGRLFGRRPEAVAAPAPEPAAVAEPAPAPVPEPAPAAEPVAVVPEPDPDPRPDPEALLVSALDTLGAAHHRPFSRG